jgi:hypothetical protein
LGLFGKKRFLFLISESQIMEKLEGNDTVELFIQRLVDYPGAAFAKLFQNFIVGDNLTDHGFFFLLIGQMFDKTCFVDAKELQK